MICTKCKCIKPVDMFRKRKSAKNGIQYWCKECERIANRARYIKKPPRKKIIKDKLIVKLQALKRMLKYRYDLSYESYILMYEQQDKSCKICENKNVLGGRNGLQVDHCHTSGKIRGLICPKCNKGMQFIDKIKSIDKIANYLLNTNQ